MRVTFLGTGTSHGVPVIGCDCAVCRSPDPRNVRLRPSILVAAGDTRLLVDATPDFRAQALRHGLNRVDAVAITHAHADHVLGLDDLRVFCGNGRKLPVYGAAPALAALRAMFSYACTESPEWPGLPSLAFHTVEPTGEFQVGGLRVRAAPLPHGRMTVLGFIFDRELAYLTDCNAVDDAVVELIREIPVLVIDALRHRPHPTHLSIDQALAVIARVQPRQAWLTHVCHEVDHGVAEQALPAHVRIAYDGLTLELNASAREGAAA